MLVRDNGGAEIAVGKFAGTLMNKEIEDALDLTLSVTLGPIASASGTVSDAGKRDCGECLLP